MTAGRTTGFTDIDRTHWTLRYLPPWARPYGRLARWDRPIGIWLLLFPCWWSSALAAAPNWAQLVGYMALFAVGALIGRNLGDAIGLGEGRPIERAGSDQNDRERRQAVGKDALQSWHAGRAPRCGWSCRQSMAQFGGPCQRSQHAKTGRGSLQ